MLNFAVQWSKYVCKYVRKGSVAASFGLRAENQRMEISRYVVGRYLSTNETFGRFFGFPIHECYATIMPLTVYLENGQRVNFTTETTAQLSEQTKDCIL